MLRWPFRCGGLDIILYVNMILFHVENIWRNLINIIPSTVCHNGPRSCATCCVTYVIKTLVILYLFHILLPDSKGPVINYREGSYKMRKLQLWFFLPSTPSRQGKSPLLKGRNVSGLSISMAKTSSSRVKSTQKLVVTTPSPLF